MAITKPVVGGDDDAWGEKVNASLDDLDSRVGTAVSTAASAASTASNALTKANSAEAAANSAASTAGSASSTAGSAVTAAQAAQTAAESAAARAALSASLVNAPPDTAVKALLDNPASQTATALSNTFLTPHQVPVRGAGDRFRTLTILCYHAVNLATFRIDLDFCQEWNYTPVTFDDVWSHLQGDSTLPDKPLLITFDDGLVSQYDAAQELNARGMVGTLFVVTGYIDGTVSQAGGGFAEAALTWAQIQQMKAWGVDMQSHTVQHQDQTGLTAAQVADEFVQSKARIEEQVPGQTVYHMAYPYGAFNDTVKGALSGVGCRLARAVRVTGDGGNPGPNKGRYMIASTQHDRLALPVAGTGNGDIQQPNYYRTLGADPELVPDFGFEAGGKGWNLGAFTIDTVEKYSGTRSLKCAQGSSTVSARPARTIPVGKWARLQLRARVLTQGLPAGALAKVQLQALKADGTVASTIDAVTVTGNNGGWTEYTYEFVGDASTAEVLVYAWLQGSGTPSGAAWWDAISVKRENLPPVLGA